MGLHDSFVKVRNDIFMTPSLSPTRAPAPLINANPPRRAPSHAVAATEQISVAVDVPAPPIPRWHHEDGFPVGPDNNKYNDDDTATIRFKGFLLVFGNATLTPLAMLSTMAVYPLIAAAEALNGDCAAAGRRLLRALAAPLVWAALEFVAVYTIVAPLAGRALYGRIEANLLYPLAPCFAPIGKGKGETDQATVEKRNAEQHLLRGTKVAGMTF